METRTDNQEAPTPPAQDFVIWWLTQEETEAVGGVILPLPLAEAVQSRYGRPGRGRLWTSGEGQPGSIVVPWPETPMGKYLQLCGGIVVPIQQAPLLACLPGLLTTLDMQRWPPLPPRGEDAPPGMLVMLPEHGPALRLVLKLEEGTGERLVLSHQQTFADLLARMVEGVPVPVGEAAELATWLRAIGRRATSQSMSAQLAAAAAYIERAQG